MTQPTSVETPAMPDGIGVELSHRLARALNASGMDALAKGALLDRVFDTADSLDDVRERRANLTWDDLPADLRAHLERVEQASAAGLLEPPL